MQPPGSRNSGLTSLTATLIGFPLDLFPPLGSYFGLMDRLWIQPRHLQKTGRKDFFPKDRNGKPSNKPGKGKKFPNKHYGIPDIMAAYVLEYEQIPFHYEKVSNRFSASLQSIPHSGTGSSQEMVSSFSAMVPVSIFALPLMGIKSVTVCKTASPAVTVTPFLRP